MVSATLPPLAPLFPYIIFDFLEDILQLFPQVFNLDRPISQKHNNKNTYRKTTQQQPQTIRKLGESDN